MSELNGNGHLNGNGKPKKVGRPKEDYAKYLPDNWKDMILEMCALGMADVQIRAKFCMLTGKFDHNMWYALKERDAEFLETINKGKVLCEAWWMQKAQEGLESKTFQTFLWFCNMKNRFGWKDKTDVEHSGSIDLTAKGILSRVNDASRLSGLPLALGN